MPDVERNRQFILEYFNAISGVEKTKDLLTEFVDDILLIDQILFFERLVPQYELIVDEITAEENRVIVRARARGIHAGEIEGIPATGKTIEIPFAIGYHIKSYKIINHWFITDQMQLLDQLGMRKIVL